MTIMVKRSQLPKEIYFDEKAGSNGVHCLDYKNESSIKYIRDDVFDQQLSAERERAGKLVEALKELAWHLDTLKAYHLVESIKQTLNEYDTATKES